VVKGWQDVIDRERKTIVCVVGEESNSMEGFYGWEGKVIVQCGFRGWENSCGMMLAASEPSSKLHIGVSQILKTP